MTEHKPIWGRWVVVGIVIGLAVAAFLSARTKDRPFGMALGQDLRGGTTLRFSLDLEKAVREKTILAAEKDEIVAPTLKLLEKRINRFGLAEVNLTSLGGNRFEISVPAEVDAESIQKVVEALGELKFRIEVRPSYPAFNPDDSDSVRTRNVVWEGAKSDLPPAPPPPPAPGVAAEPAPAPAAAPETFEPTEEGFNAFKKREIERFRQARDKGEDYHPLDHRYRLVPVYRGENVAPPTADADFRVIEEPEAKVEQLGGEILANVRPGQDRVGRPGVSFDVKVDYHRNFKEWTTKNVGLPMAIVLNGYYDQAPTINSPLEDSVIVTLGGGGGGPGDREAHKEVLKRQQELIATLQSGSLRVTPRFEAKSRVGPTLAGEAVRLGLLSTAIAFALVLLYMAIYYYVAGLIADVALFLNLVLIVGAMCFLHATLTLPGIAGVVLTLGMAVDANILIYERIREELHRGRSVAQAVSEGFGRAFATIVDSNVTTLFTGLFLFLFGTGAIQGFAITLMLGLTASMFTAVYVTRTFFEMWMRTGVKTIKMLGTAKVPSIQWMKLRKRFIPISIALMVASLVLFFLSKDSTVYDIEFTGGMKIQARFNEPIAVDAVKAALDQGVKEVSIKRPGAPAGSAATYKVKAGPYGAAEVVAVRTEGRWIEARHALTPETGPDTLTSDAQLDAFRAYLEEVFRGKLIPSWMVESPAPYKAKDDKDPMKAREGQLRFKIAIEDPSDVLTAERMKKAFVRMPFFFQAEGEQKRTAMPTSTVVRDLEVIDAGKAEGGEAKLYEVFWKSTRASGGEVENNPDSLKVDLREFLSGARFKDVLRGEGVSAAKAGDVVLADPFPVNDQVGPSIARRTRDDAMKALLLSFVAIVLYVAFRFRSYAMGFSSVLCLVHDVVLTLGAVCVADHLGIVDAKINMGLVAAFLTLVGYSVNDTVVTFDRIRELRGKAPRITGSMIDLAINQTLARTVRTSVTVFLTLVVLFFVNFGARSMLEGISYALLFGVVVGTYSSIGIASPLLLFLPWFWARVRHLRPQLVSATWPTKKPYGAVFAGGCALVAIAIAFATRDVWKGVFLGLLVLPVLLTVGVYALWALAFSVYCFVAGCVLVVPWSFHEDPDAAAEQARQAIAADAPAPVASAAEPEPASKGGTYQGKKKGGSPSPGTAPA